MGRPYVNVMVEEGRDPIRRTYRDNDERLVKIKDKYDPEHFFHVNQNISGRGDLTLDPVSSCWSSRPSQNMNTAVRNFGF
jgi:Berberine and berberine like